MHTCHLNSDAAGLPVYFLSVKRLRERAVAALGAIALCPLLCSQQSGLGTSVITAHVKGPDQINLTWAAVADPGYGYLVEIQSATDTRFTDWTELEPIPRARGYTCDSTIVARGARCNISDPAG